MAAKNGSGIEGSTLVGVVLSGVGGSTLVNVVVVSVVKDSTLEKDMAAIFDNVGSGSLRIVVVVVVVPVFPILSFGKMKFYYTVDNHHCKGFQSTILSAFVTPLFFG